MRLSDREITFIKIGSLFAVFLLVLALYLLPSYGKMKSYGRSISYYTEVLEKIIPLSQKLKGLEATIRARSRKLPKSPMTADEFRRKFGLVAEKSGIPASSLEIKFTGTMKKEDFMESSFRVEVKNITYPETLRLIQNLESTKEHFVIREGIIKPTFESNEYLELTLKVSVITKEHVQ